MTEQKIILLHESWHLSAKRDAFSVLCAFAMIGPGVYLNSSAMQWFGFGAAMAVIFSRASGLRKKHERTLDQAQAEIAAMLAERNRK